MKKGFISYRFTGEKIEDLNSALSQIQNKLKEVDVDAYCNLFDKNLPVSPTADFKAQDFVFDAFKKINGTDILFTYITSENKSEGMILEVGYALAKNIPLVVAIKDDVKNTYLPVMANLVIQYNDLNDLLEKISETDFNSLSH